MASININIDLESIGQAFAQVIEKFQSLSAEGIFLVILALILPPLAVLIKVGLTTHLLINVILTILGFVPGQIHAVWVVLFL
jgi:uncharacterized membrane protein YqaE (UPF0057 family)